MKTFAIILAAGRGSRMKDLTANKPKCMIKLAGKTLLEWQVQALNKAGITDIHLVKGYMADCLPDHFSSSYNARWPETNMLFSLNCATNYIQKMFNSGFGQFILSYSDIVYSPVCVHKLLQASSDIAITYDILWRDLWQLRFDNILEDAETFRQKDGILLEIGGKTNILSEIEGQYMGLLKLTTAGWERWKNAVTNLGQNCEKTDMTTFLELLIRQNEKIAAIPVEGKWCEADSAEDLKKYELALGTGEWKHDWCKEN